MKNAPQVLVVEDDEDDFFLTQRAIRKFTAGAVVHVENGRAAIDYLAGEGPYGDRIRFPMPDVIFMDLKMDRVSGHEVLAWIHSTLGKSAPAVFVLTGSNEPRDRETAKNSGVASGYIVKPLSAEHLSVIFAEESAGAKNV